MRVRVHRRSSGRRRVPFLRAELRTGPRLVAIGLEVRTGDLESPYVRMVTAIGMDAVCGTDRMLDAVCGTDRRLDAVYGTDRRLDAVCGTDRLLDAVCGTDRLLDAEFNSDRGPEDRNRSSRKQTGVMWALSSLTGGLGTGLGLTAVLLIDSIFEIVAVQMTGIYILTAIWILTGVRGSGDRQKTEVWKLLEIGDQAMTGDRMAPVTLMVIVLLAIEDQVMTGE
jgi:hypothetical protein